MTRLVLAFAILVCALPLGVRSSGATFVAASANPGARFAAATDFNTVSVSLADPGTPLRGAVTLSASAASNRGIASVTLQSAPAGTSSWTDACIATTAPFSCSFDTTKVADGRRDIRAVALDRAGYTRTATVTGRLIDNTAPSSSLTDPGALLTGPVTLTATAADGGSGLASLNIQYRPAGGGAWTDVCRRTSTPAPCSLATTGLADGLYDVRAEAIDAAGNSGTAVVTGRRVDNTAPTIGFFGPGAAIRGQVVIESTPADAGGIASVRYQVRPFGASAWDDACVASAAPFSCGGDTTQVPDGRYEARAIATDAAGFSTTSAAITTWIDNTAPAAVTMTDPGSLLAGAAPLAGAATDAGSGIASLRFERAAAGTGTWTTACSATTAPYGCSWATTAAADGLYDLRAVATDAAGNTRATGVLASRRVDNAGPTVALADPGSPLRRTVTLGAGASDAAGVVSVTIRRRPAGSSGAWTTVCVDSTTSSFSCPWDTTAVPDGAYDLQAIALDGAGRSTTSATVAARVVDNTAPRGTDVQAANGSGAVGTIDAGDTLTFSHSEAMAPGSMLASWTGAATAVTVRLTNGGSSDTLAIWNAANTARLSIGGGTADVQLNANRTGSAGATFSATAELTGTTIVVRLGARIAGTSTASTSTTPMTWTPSAAATDRAGNACATTTVTEAGSADRDF